ncbi:Hsp70 nucleotide exchange factor fes1 [Gracilariopsis chorda]|uniref:Hsp70 nucleotide exchange factor fes1 n=1 Tax=Gracilariopsis chorda TaxID=448386 RepID=A0A2V3IV92_9FLOR|nr:Hsp70 nucleotide exchange factor fes1 [Gracilariopsis chorda]|eukprot:PXF46009.1 Hsp70 nucleotide exchange factor fes1 [Gracilariopsis chorda]
MPSRYSISLLLLLFVTSTRAAQLPAVRKRPYKEEKRALASRLLRDADSNKRRSLRDVLDEHVVPPSESIRQGSPSTVSTKPEPKKQPVSSEDGFVFRSVSQLFAWAINQTTTSRGRNSTISISLSAAIEHELPPESPTLQATQRQGALPSSASHHSDFVSNKRPESPSEKSNTHSSSFSASFAEYSEFDLLRQNIHILETPEVGVSRVVTALLQLEELCHSIDNGRDLQLSGGLKPLVKSLSASQHVVRANAAWALATCCQNNPTVQNASLQLDAVPTLARLAANDDATTVRARALFALNAILEVEDARVVFEHLPSSIDALRRSLSDSRNIRATRRALNLAELLLTKNLDTWKTMLEAWDLPIIVERLMRQHRNSDVRESAARAIAAMDGRHIA